MGKRGRTDSNDVEMELPPILLPIREDGVETHTSPSLAFTTAAFI